MKVSKQQAIRFDGQGVVITGAGRGLGAAYAKLVATRGGTIVVHYAGVAQDGGGFDPSVADAVSRRSTAQEGSPLLVTRTSKTPAAGERIIKFAVSRFGRADVLINNAGLVVFASLEQTELAIWNRIVAIGISARFSWLAQRCRTFETKVTDGSCSRLLAEL